jgi:hypothetical protein
MGGVLTEVIAAFLFLAILLLGAGALLTRPLWLPYLQSLRMEARQRRMEAMRQAEQEEFMQAAEEEIEAECHPAAAHEEAEKLPEEQRPQVEESQAQEIRRQ